MSDRPTTGQVEQRTAAVEVEDRRIRGLIPYSTPSRDLGGWREVIEPGAFNRATLDELRAVVDHKGVPLGRFPTTLDVEDRDDGLHWSLDPPKSRADVIEAIERGDMRAGSWRMVVARDEWRGDTRHVHEVAELRDVTIVGSEEPAYGDAATVEYRTHNEGGERRRKGGAMPPQDEDGAAENRSANENENENRENENRENEHEDRTAPTPGTLRVEDRSQGVPHGLADAFRSRGWPDERATLEYVEYRAAIETRTLGVTGVDDINRVERQAAPLGFDQRFIYPSFNVEPVGRDVTSVVVLAQSTRQLAATGDVIRDLAETSTKPETSSGVEPTTVALKQVASVETGIPNVYLEQAAVKSVIDRDLAYAHAAALDGLVLAALAASDNHDPASDPLLVAIRKGITLVQAAGYSPDLLVLDPTSAEALDVLVSGVSGGDNDYVFAPAQLAPRSMFGMRAVIAKSAPAPAVVDSTAFGKLHAGPVSLERFEENAGASNSSTVRLESHAVFGAERSDAAIRIAAA